MICLLSVIPEGVVDDKCRWVQSTTVDCYIAQASCIVQYRNVRHSNQVLPYILVLNTWWFIICYRDILPVAFKIFLFTFMETLCCTYLWTCMKLRDCFEHLHSTPQFSSTHTYYSYSVSMALLLSWLSEIVATWLIYMPETLRAVVLNIIQMF